MCLIDNWLDPKTCWLTLNGATSDLMLSLAFDGNETAVSLLEPFDGWLSIVLFLMTGHSN